MSTREALTWLGMASLLLLAVCSSSPAYAELPERPQQTVEEIEAAIADGQCPEQPIFSDRPVVLQPCDGIILPLVVWRHLEELAVDSRTVRGLYQLQAEKHSYTTLYTQDRIDDLIEQLDAERAPTPLLQRPSVIIGASMVGGAAAVLAGGWALSLVGG